MLIVERHRHMRAALREFLAFRYPEAAILEAASGLEALRLVGERAPSVVLTDLGLPDMSGAELTRRIKAAAAGVQVIILSQHSGEWHRQRAQVAGALGFVVKDRIHAELPPLVDLALRDAPER